MSKYSDKVERRRRAEEAAVEKPDDVERFVCLADHAVAAVVSIDEALVFICNAEKEIRKMVLAARSMVKGKSVDLHNSLVHYRTGLLRAKERAVELGVLAGGTGNE